MRSANVRERPRPLPKRAFAPSTWLGRILALSLACLAFPALTRASLEVPLENGSLEVRVLDDAPYLSLSGFAAQQFFEYEFSLSSQTFTLQNPSPEEGAQNLVFRAGSDEVLADGVPARLSRPTILEGEILWVPVREFLSLALGREAAAVVPIRPKGGTPVQLVQALPVLQGATKKLVLDFDGRPEVHLSSSADQLQTELVLEGISPTLAPTFLQSLEAAMTSSEQILAAPGEVLAPLYRLRFRFQFQSPHRPEGFFVEENKQYVLRWHPEAVVPQIDLAATPLGVSRNQLRKLRVGIDLGPRFLVADPKQGDTQTDALLPLHEELYQALSSVGIPAKYIRDTDQHVPMPQRIDRIHRLGLDLLVSVHLRDRQATEADTGPRIFVLPTGDLFHPRATGPDPATRIQAAKAAETLARHLGKKLEQAPPLIKDPTLMPMAQSVPPGFAIDLGPAELLLPSSTEHRTYRAQLIRSLAEGIALGLEGDFSAGTRLPFDEATSDEPSPPVPTPNLTPALVSPSQAPTPTPSLPEELAGEPPLPPTPTPSPDRESQGMWQDVLSSPSENAGGSR